MNRFFKSAAFPIIIVILLALFAQRVLFDGAEEQKPKRDWATMVADLKNGKVDQLKHKLSDNTVQVQLDETKLG